jgi:hypothetical protein
MSNPTMSRHEGEFLPQQVNPEGYAVVTLVDDDGVERVERVDLLVANAFIPNPNG